MQIASFFDLLSFIRVTKGRLGKQSKIQPGYKSAKQKKMLDKLGTNV